MTPAEQYRAATEGAAMFDVSDRALIEVSGRDRGAFLHNFCTNDIKKLQPGQGCEAFVTNVKGRILGHILVFAEQDSLWISGDSGTQRALLAHLDRYVITEDVQFHDRTGALGQLLVAGPGAAAALGIDAEGLPMCGRASGTSQVGIGLRRVPLTVGPAFLLTVDQAALVEVRSKLEASGVAPVGSDLLEVLRIEALWPRYGVDLTEEQLAQEAGRTGPAISFTKGCYLGQEPIARLDALGHTNRELRGILCSAPGALSAGAVVLDAGGATEVGRVSSVAVNPATNCAVAFAMVKTVANKPGTAVRVRGESGEEVDGVVFGLPAVG